MSPILMSPLVKWTFVALGGAMAVHWLVKEVRRVNEELDAQRARVRIRDQEVDQMYNAMFREFLTHMMEDPRNITACMHLHFIAKNLERVGDHATSIAEQVIYLVTGRMPDDNRPKGDNTSFVSSEGNA